MHLEHIYTCVEGQYLEQLTETAHCFTKGVKVQVSVGTKQKHDQNNDVGVVLERNNFVNRDTMVRSMGSECAEEK